MSMAHENRSGVDRVLKHDLFGRIAMHLHDEVACICRDARHAASGLRWLARLLAGNEARALRRLDGLAGVPALLSWDGRVLRRQYITARPMHEARPCDPRFFGQARRLLQRMHRQGIAHNDLAKEANWLVTDSGEPALIDFQMAWHGKGRLYRLRAREDLRHLLKHKRTYCPERLTPVERRLLARRSWIRDVWFATGKPVYRWVTRRLLRWRDNEGRNPP